MYKLYKKSLNYDRRTDEYKKFLLDNCDILEINQSKNISLNCDILTFKRTNNDLYKIYMYLLVYLNGDCVKHIFKYIDKNEYTTQDWYMDLYDIMRCKGINNIFHKLYETDKPMPDLEIPWIYYDCEIISYINCFVLTQINKGPIFPNKYLYDHKNNSKSKYYVYVYGDKIAIEKVKEKVKEKVNEKVNDNFLINFD